MKKFLNLVLIFTFLLSSSLFFSACKQDKIEYNVAISSVLNGTITANKSKACEGEAVILTVTANNGYMLKENSLKYNNTIIDNDVYFFEMPAENVVITAEFIEKSNYSITTSLIENGYIQLSQTSAYAGQEIQLVVTPNSGYKLKENSLKYNGIVIQGLSFIMPAENVLVTAEFVEDDILKTCTQHSVNGKINGFYVLDVLNNTLASANSPTYIQAFAFKSDNTFYEVLVMKANNLSIAEDWTAHRDNFYNFTSGTYAISGNVLTLTYTNNANALETQAKIVGSTIVFEQIIESASGTTITTSTYKYCKNSTLFDTSTMLEFCATEAYINGNQVSLSQIYSDYDVYKSIKGNSYNKYYKRNNDDEYTQNYITQVGNYFYFTGDNANNCFEIVDDNTIILTLRKTSVGEGGAVNVVLVKVVYEKTT